MVSTQNIFGLMVGAFYAAFAPIGAYLLLRTFVTLKARYVALGVLVFILCLILNRMLVGSAMLAIGAMTQSSIGYSNSVFWSIFLYKFPFDAAYALLNLAACFLLLKYFASRQEGLGPGLAYAIGAGGFYCILIADYELHDLQLALTTNEYGLQAAFGPGMRISGDFLASNFAYGIPRGAGAVFHLLFEIILASLIWKGILEKRWTPVAAAIGLSVGLSAALGVLAALVLFVPFTVYDSLFGIAAVGALVWREPILNWLDRIAPRRSPGEAGPPSLWSTWLDQARRNDRTG